MKFLTILKTSFAITSLLAIGLFVVLKSQRIGGTSLSDQAVPFSHRQHLSKEHSKNGGATPQLVADWLEYRNTAYGYAFFYPRTATISSLNPQQSNSVADAIMITAYSGRLGMKICAAENSTGASAKELFELWTSITDPASAPSLCATFKRNVRSVAETSIGSLMAYEAKIFTYDAYELCSFLTTKQSLIAICLPEETPADPSWRELLGLYHHISSTFKTIAPK